MKKLTLIPTHRVIRRDTCISFPLRIEHPYLFANKLLFNKLKELIYIKNLVVNGMETTAMWLGKSNELYMFCLQQQNVLTLSTLAVDRRSNLACVSNMLMALSASYIYRACKNNLIYNCNLS